MHSIMITHMHDCFARSHSGTQLCRSQKLDLLWINIIDLDIKMDFSAQEPKTTMTTATTAQSKFDREISPADTSHLHTSYLVLTIYRSVGSAPRLLTRPLACLFTVPIYMIRYVLRKSKQ